MISFDDRTPEERRADLRAEVDAELEAMTEQRMKELLRDTIRVLVLSNRDDCAKAVMKVTKRMESAEAQINARGADAPYPRH